MIRVVAGKLGRFEEICLQEFVPESFRWTDFWSHPGTKSQISKFCLAENGQVFMQPLHRAPGATVVPFCVEATLTTTERRWNNLTGHEDFIVKALTRI